MMLIIFIAAIVQIYTIMFIMYVNYIKLYIAKNKPNTNNQILIAVNIYIIDMNWDQEIMVF